MSRPRLRLGRHLWRGLGAVALFGVLAYVVLTSPFGDPAGFGEGSITASIGYAIVGLEHLAPHEGTESFLVALIGIAIVLDAALEGALMLARRDVGGRIVGALHSGGDEE